MDGPRLQDGLPDGLPDSLRSDDPEFQTRQARYHRQVSLYAQAVERATGQPAKGILLYV